jgi:integrase
VALTTFVSYRDAIRLHLAPAFGDYPLTKLSAQAIRDYITTKLAAGLSPKTVAYHRTILRTALQQAVEDGLLARNAAALVKAPPKHRRPMQVLDEEQVRVFLAEAKRFSPHYRLYLAAITTGMRQGELLGLRWQDVDLALGVASIQQTFYRLGGNKKTGDRAQMLFKAPKTEKSRRPIPLPAVVVEELRTLHDEQAERRRLLGEKYEDRGLVFCQVNGRPLHAHNIIRRDFHKMLALDGLREDLRKQGLAEDTLPKELPRIRFHDLRHCCATMLLQQGVHPKVVQELLGHTTIAMTLDTYSHVLPGIKEEAIRGLEARLFAGALLAR